jgi:hypothetical protein
MHGAGVRRGLIIDSASIVDLAPTILYWLNCPIPADLDGAVLTSCLTAEAQHERQIVSTTPLAPSEAHFELSAQDEHELLQRLQDLGYVD